ncbi:MAG: LysM peptidoglycan-binding domain-containing protein [Dethiobacteria bacterium]|jgi:spore coat assembly protein SafA
MMRPRIPSSCPAGFRGRYTVVSGDTMFFIAQRFGISLSSLIAANPHITNPNMIFPGDVLCVPREKGGRIPASCPAGFRDRYTVVSGDTMFLIAKRFRVGLDSLIAANPQITDPDVIFPGDVLCVPGRRPDHGHGHHGHHGRPDHPDRHDHHGGHRHDHREDYGDYDDDYEEGYEHGPHGGDYEHGYRRERKDCNIPPSCPADFEGLYTVQTGDTMFSIAQYFDVNLDALLAANPHIVNPKMIFPGDMLCVPSRVPKRCPADFKERYTVQVGDTMYSIAQYFSVNVDSLIAANPHIIDPNIIFPGDELCVP